MMNESNRKIVRFKPAHHQPAPPLAPERLRRITAAILIIGFSAAIILYFIAIEKPVNPLGYEPLETKKYIHDLELYGGKANVLGAQFMAWFSGLWYGKNLSYTVAVLTIFTALAVRFFATLPSRSAKD